MQARNIIQISALLIGFTAVSAQADPYTFFTKIIAASNVDGTYGGCHVKVTGGTFTAAGVAGCQYSDFISFNCDAVAATGGANPLNTKAQGLAKFSAAQLAYVSDQRVFVTMPNPSVNINGVCWASGIQVQP